MKKKFQRESSRAIWNSNFANKTLDTFSYPIFGTDTFRKVNKILKKYPNFLKLNLEPQLIERCI